MRFAVELGADTGNFNDGDGTMQMTDNRPPAARLKGVGDSLWVTLNPELPVAVLQNELHVIFSRLKHLAVNARVVLDPGEGGGHGPLLDSLSAYLKENFNVGMVSAPDKKPPRATRRVRARELHRGMRYRRSNVLMMTGRVRSGQKLEADKHLILLGDVNPGGQVLAGGDIFIMGSLLGTACAGMPKNESAIIFSLDFRPSQIQIGGFVAAGQPSDREKTAEFACVENGVIIVQDYLKANPFGKVPWPEIR